EGLQVELRLGFMVPVAGVAVGREDRPDLAGIAGRGGLPGARRAEARPDQDEGAGEEERGDRGQRARAKASHVRPSSQPHLVPLYVVNTGESPLRVPGGDFLRDRPWVTSARRDARDRGYPPRRR